MKSDVTTKTKRRRTRREAAVASAPERHSTKTPQSGVGRGAASTPLRELRARFGLTQTLVARLLGVSVRTVTDLERGNRSTAAASRSIEELRRMLDSLAKVMQSGAIAGWLDKPNEGFGGFKPVEVIERGKVDQIWQMIFRVGSGHPM